MPHRHPTLLPVVSFSVLGLWLSECNKLWVKIESNQIKQSQKNFQMRLQTTFRLGGSCLPWQLHVMTQRYFYFLQTRSKTLTRCDWDISACGWTLVHSSFLHCRWNLSQCITSLIQHNMGWNFLLKQQGASSASAATNAIGSRFLLGSSSSSTSCMLDTGLQSRQVATMS